MEKHLQNHALWRKVMRISITQALMLILFTGMTYALDSKAQVLNKLVSIHAANQEIYKVLHQLETQADIKFVFSPQVIRAKKKITVHIENEKFGTLLDRIFQPLNIKYELSGKYVLLSDAKPASFSLFTSPALKQPLEALSEKELTGTVTDEAGSALPGVSIVVKGTQMGTTTDADGKFSIRVADRDVTLVFSFVGYTSQEISPGSKTNLSIALQPSQSLLEEVLVVGYGTQKRGDVTGAITSISNKDIAGVPVPSLEGVMAGRMPGVQVSQPTGTPGGGLSVRVRGAGSIGAGNEPLYVIDGFPVMADYNQTSSPLNTINPSDIESIEVLKDASATAIYGSRGSNGVIIITTKGGKTGKMKIDVDAYTGVQSVTKYMDLMNAKEFAQYIIDSRNNGWTDTGGLITAPNSARSAIYRIPEAIQDPGTLGEGTNWQKEIFRQAPTHNMQLTLSGGNDRIKYLTSANYYKQNGIIINSDFERYSFRVNLESQATKRFKMGVNVTPSYTISNPTGSEGHWANGGIVLSALTMAPHIPVFDANGNYTTGMDLGNGFSAIENPVKLATQRTNKLRELRVLGTVYGEYRFFNNLTYKLLVGTDLRASGQNTFSPSTVGLTSVVPPVVPTGSYATQQSTNWLIEHTLNYSKSWNKHQFDALAGYTSQKVQSYSSSIFSTNFPNDLVETLNAGIPTSANTTAYEWSLISYLARINYSYASKYLLTATLRRDGSSRFGDNNKWGTFPSVSAGWRISEEAFLKNIKPISELKLRASYGLTGNNFIGNYDHVGLIAKQNYVFGGAIVNGLGPNSISNPDLSWERNRQFDIGLELGLFQNRIFVITDYYRKITSDLLLNVPTPSLTGYTSARQNIGKVKNTGWELGLSTRNLTGDLKWSTDFNISFNRNVVVALGPSGEPIFGNYQLSSTHITQVGSPMGNFYGYEVVGIFQNQQEIADNPSFADSKPGHFRFRDVNRDGKLSIEDRTILGNPMPDFTYGLTNTLSFKGFDLSILLQGVQGSEIMHLGRRYYANYAGTANGMREMLNSWKSEENPGDGKTPRVNRDLSRYASSNASANVSSVLIEDGSFLRIRNVSLGYSIPTSYLNKLLIRTARIYANLQNPITWTKYTGYNPEVSVQGGSPLEPGVDHGGYPIAKVFTIGLTVGF